jgi:hypothetical protein
MKGSEIRATCGPCGEEQHLAGGVPTAAWNKFVLREGLVQDLFPALSSAERELVMGARNGFGYICEDCWGTVFEELAE